MSVNLTYLQTFLTFYVFTASVATKRQLYILGKKSICVAKKRKLNWPHSFKYLLLFLRTRTHIHSEPSLWAMSDRVNRSGMSISLSFSAHPSLSQEDPLLPTQVERAKGGNESEKRCKNVLLFLLSRRLRCLIFVPPSRRPREARLRHEQEGHH